MLNLSYLRLTTLGLAIVIGIAMFSAATPNTLSLNQPDPGTSRRSALIAKAQQKFAHATQVADTFITRAAASGLNDEWHIQLINALMQGPESQFENVRSAPSVHAAMLFALKLGRTSSADDSPRQKALGDLSDDLVYLPFESPCRIVDTRPAGAGGPLQAGSTTDFSLAPNVASQGGSLCPFLENFIRSGYPSAAAVNITVVSTPDSVPGSFLRAYADNGNSPTSWLNFGPSQTIANQGILPINSVGQFTIFVNGTTQVIVDVFGVFSAPSPTPLSCRATNETIVTVTQNSTKAYTQTDLCGPYASPVAAICTTTAPGVYLAGSAVAVETSQSVCYWTNTTSSPQSAAQGTFCCGVPGTIRSQ